MNILRESLIQIIEQAIKTLNKNEQVQAAFKRLSKVVSDRNLPTSSSNLELNTLDEMLEINIDGQSLKEALITAKQFKAFNNYLLKNKQFLSTITAHELCRLASSGDLEAIQKVRISPYLVTKLVDNALISGPATYMGRYNALLIAISNRNIDVVKFFIEKLGVRLDIKGGRKSDLSIIDCAGQPGFFMFPAINTELQTYITQKYNEQSNLNNNRNKETKRTYKDALQFTLMPPSTQNTVSDVPADALKM